LKDFFDFPSNESTAIFFKKLKEYQFQNSKVYAVNQNLSKYDIIKEGDTSLAGRDLKRGKIFENYINSKTISYKNAQAIDGIFPLIIYHQGLGGTVDENYVLLEYLASNGYIVINSAFQVGDPTGYSDGWFVGVGEHEQTFADFNFIINYCKKNKISKSNKTFLAGHSFGANFAITYIGQGHKNVTGIIPLDSVFGYVINNFFPKKDNPFTQERIKYYHLLPIFCANRSEAHF
jgi:predicted alpha/beta-fold hydrolase